MNNFNNTANKIEELRSEDYTYDLPEEKIAVFPLEKRNESKLLVYREHTIADDIFSNIATHIASGAHLVLNNTKVIPARLLFKKDTGAQIEIFCLEPHNGDYIGSALKAANRTVVWQCMIKNKTKWKSGSLEKKNGGLTLSVHWVGEQADVAILRFEWNNPTMNFEEILSLFGEMPIPPYFKRSATEKDKQSYQTTFSKQNGSVAVPTASLHFTADEFEKLQAKNISISELTLHVGAGTFKPIKTDTVGAHVMHSEWIEITFDFVQKYAALSGDIVAVGTTVLRSLESLYFLAHKLKNGETDLTVTQWEPYQQRHSSLNRKDVFLIIADYMRQNQLNVLQFKSQLMIVPGYRFFMSDFLITNFHQPHSTLLLLVAAAVGDDWRKIYRHALDNNYRFLSYGDSSLLQISQFN